MMAYRLLWLALALAAPALADDNDFALCILCHGTNANGNPSVRAPKLAGMERWHVRRQLQAFRSGLRGTHAQDVAGEEMRAIALSLRERDIERAIDFVASLKPHSPPTSVAGDAARGRTLYAACAPCHGERGQGNEGLHAPALVHGSDWYWVIQLNNFRNGVRGAHADDTIGATMRAAAQSLPDEQAVQDVVAYINTLR